MQSSRLVRAVFVVLVLATVGTFFATQRLKTEVPVVLRFAGDPRHISPNNDGVRDSTRVGFDLSEPAEVSFGIVDSEGNQVRELFAERRLAGDTKHRFSWDGRDDEGNVVPDGRYRLRVVRRDQAQPLDSIKKIIVDTRPPKVRIAAVRPNVISPGVRGGREAGAGALRRPAQRRARVPRLAHRRGRAARDRAPLPRQRATPGCGTARCATGPRGTAATRSRWSCATRPATAPRPPRRRSPRSRRRGRAPGSTSAG